MCQFNSNQHGTWKEEKKGGGRKRQRRGTTPTVVASLENTSGASVGSTGLFLPKERIIENQGESQGS